MESSFSLRIVGKLYCLPILQIKEKVCYVKFFFFFCVLGVFVLYFIFFLIKKNKNHNILFIRKLKNPINIKILIFPLNNIIYIILK
jgi:hypothetical protein